MKNPADAEEAAQDVFAKALEALPRFTNHDESLGAWLFQIARHQGIDQLRKKSRMCSVEPSHFGWDESEMASASDAFAAESRGSVREVLRSLPESQQRVLALRLLFDFRAPEIADLLGMTADAVRHAQARGLRTIQSKLEEHGIARPVNVRARR